MRIAVRYYTKSGNTEKLAKAIAEAVGVEAQDVSVALNEKADLLFLGNSVYAAGVDEEVKRFIHKNAEKIGKLVNFGTAAIISSTYKQVKREAESISVPVAEEEFHCRGSFSILHKNRPNEQDVADAAAFAKAVVERYSD